MVVIDNNLSAYGISATERNESLVHYQLSANVFARAKEYLISNDVAIVDDDCGNPLFAIKMEVTTYFHSYSYTGEIDTSFLDRYDNIILNECNEYAIELYLNGLQYWKGNRLIFIGDNWEHFLDILPQYDSLDYYYEPILTDVFLANLFNLGKTLSIMPGNPHTESLDRYKQNIMFYDEIMLLTFMFSDKRFFGMENEDKRYFIIDARYGNLGLFGIQNKAINYAKYIKAKGYIPIISLRNEHGSLGIYQDYRGDDFWSKFFNQPEGISVADVAQCSNVYFAPEAYNATIIEAIMAEYSHDIELSWPDGMYCKDLENYISDRRNKFLPNPGETLGVLARGTDYINTHFSNHPVHASKEMIREKIDELIEQWGLKYIYLATEDEGYCKYFKEVYGDRIRFTDQIRFSTGHDEMLAELIRKRGNDQGGGFDKGAEYFLSIYLLSRCDSLLASGYCNGTVQALEMNAGEYRNRFVF